MRAAALVLALSLASGFDLGRGQTLLAQNDWNALLDYSGQAQPKETLDRKRVSRLLAAASALARPRDRVTSLALAERGLDFARTREALTEAAKSYEALDHPGDARRLYREAGIGPAGGAPGRRGAAPMEPAREHTLVDSEVLAPQQGDAPVLTKEDLGVMSDEDVETETSRHFTVAYSGRGDRAARVAYGRGVLRVLETGYALVERELGLAPRKAVAVYLYSNAEYHERYPAESGYTAGIYFRGAIRVNMGLPMTKQVEETLVHEYTHYAVDSLLGGEQVPSWVQEGTAMWIQCRYDRPQIPHPYAGTPPPLAELDPRKLAASRAGGEAAYQKAWAAVSVLIQNPQDRDKWIDLLKRVAQGDPFSRAFKEMFRGDAEDVDENADRLLKSGEGNCR